MPKPPTAEETKTQALQCIATQVRQRRDAAGFSQLELAGRAGIAPRHLQKIEAAEVNITVATLAKLASALGTQVASLVAPAPDHP